MYDTHKKHEEEDNDDNNEMNENYYENESEKDKNDKMKQKYGVEAKFHILILPDGEFEKPLPKIITLENPLPNEPACMKKRSGPKALRFYKAKNDRDTTRFYLHELMLYRSFNKELFKTGTPMTNSAWNSFLSTMKACKKLKVISSSGFKM